MWVEPAGHAATNAELVRDLYAAAAERWVADGLALHYAMVPASDRALVDAWFRLGFGHQQVYAIRETPPAGNRSEGPGDLVLRVARLDDLDALARLDVALPAHQALSPVFSRRALPTVEDARAEYEADFDDPRFATFVVERNGEVIGSAIACAIELSSDHKSLALPPGAGFLGFAAVLPEARGVGAGRLLGEAVLEWARETHREWVVTDWRMTNLLSSRAWPRLGFRPTFYRLHRAIA
jgi:GNAT superfamily N-acetyltransferase